MNGNKSTVEDPQDARTGLACLVIGSYYRDRYSEGTKTSEKPSSICHATMTSHCTQQCQLWDIDTPTACQVVVNTSVTTGTIWAAPRHGTMSYIDEVATRMKPATRSDLCVPLNSMSQDVITYQWPRNRFRTSFIYPTGVSFS